MGDDCGLRCSAFEEFVIKALEDLKLMNRDWTIAL